MSLIDQKKKIEFKSQKLTKLETEYSVLKSDPTKSEECAKLRNDISQLRREIEELTMQFEVNATMIEYAQKKDDPRNSALCSSLKDRAATIMYRSWRSLVYTASKYYAGRGSKEDWEDAVQTAFIEAFEKYDPQKNDNFCAYFYSCLRYVVLNTLRIDYEDTQAKKKKNPTDSQEKNGSSLDDNAEKSGRYKKRVQSVDTPKDSEDRPPSAPVIDPSLTPDELCFARMTLEEFYTRLTVCVVRINPSKYNRAFATEWYIRLCREHLNTVLYINENEAFNQVMSLDFADFTLDGVCRSFAEIEITPCKLYSEFGLYPIRKNNSSTKWVGRLRIPFENPIYGKFFGVTDSRITQKRNEFNEKVGIEER